MVSHDIARAGVARLRLGIGVVLALGVVEVLVSRYTSSLALLSDAGHLATDAATLGLAAYALKLGQRPATARHTYGFKRSGVVIAAVNGLVLLAIAFAIALGAVSRLQHPQTVTPAPVIVVAILALVVNLGLYWMLSEHSHELSVRSAALHVASDAVASVGVITAAAIILITGFQAADAIVSLGIAFLIAAGAAQLVSQATAVLDNMTPRDIDPELVRATMTATPGVEDVHDLHIWSMDGSHRAMSAHLTVADQSLTSVTNLLRELERNLCADYAIEHVTLQPESPTCVTDAAPYCDLDERHAIHSRPVRAAKN